MANMETSTFTRTGVYDAGYLQEHFIAGFQILDPVWPLLFKQESTMQPTVRSASWGGAQAWGTKTEAADVTYQTAAEGYVDEFAVVSYASGFNWSLEAAEDQQHGEIAQYTQDLGQGAQHLIETTNSNHLNNAFAAGTTFGDGVALCATNHPVIITGGTSSNRSGSDTALSYTTLNTAYIDMDNVVDGAGKYSGIRPDTLIVPPDLAVTAQQITESSVTDGDLQVNVFAGRGLKVVVWPFLTDTNAWFLMDSTKNRFKHIWRRPVMMESFPTPRSHVDNYQGSMRFVSGPHGDWRFLYGNAGA